MKRLLLIVSVFIVGCLYFPICAQLTVEYCQEKARENYPLIKRYDLIEKSREYNLSNAGKGYLPQFSISAKATYQTQVTELPVTIPGIEIKQMKKDQYGATLDVSQVVWDGGTINARKESIKTNSEVDYKQLEVDLYPVNQRVNQLFFGILLLDAKLEQNQLYKLELERNFNTVSSYITNGIANQTDLDVIKIEQLNARQTDVQLYANRKAYVEMLSILIGEYIGENTVLLLPDAGMWVPAGIKRPELDLFKAQLDNLDVQKKSIRSSYMPQIGLFGTGGYGNPGLNMLKPEFSAYFVGGLKLSWNFGSLYTKKNDIKLIELNKDNVLTQQDTFLFNTAVEMSQEENEVSKNRDLLKYDDEIIALRANVKNAAEAKVANGILTVSDLVKEIISEEMAKQDKIQHEIELLQSVYDLKYTTNN